MHQSSQLQPQQKPQRYKSLIQQIKFSGRIKLKDITMTTPISSNSHPLDLPQLSSKNFSILCNLSKQNLTNLPNKFVPTSAQFVGDNIVLSQFICVSQIQDENMSSTNININNKSRSKNALQIHKQYAINIRNQNDRNFDRLMFQKYNCQYIKDIHSKNGLQHLKLSVKNTEQFVLQFHQIQRPRFAKTKKLQQILLISHKKIDTPFHIDQSQQSQHVEHSGIVTMDQSGRFLVQSDFCNFPAVGIWLRCPKIQSVQVYTRLYSYLFQKPTKKFVKFQVGHQGSNYNYNYIVFVRIWENQLPELYLVNWKLIQDNTNTNTNQSEIHAQYQIKQNKQLTLELKRHNFQFTLRCQQKTPIPGPPDNSTPSQLQLQFTSPRKQFTNQQLQQQLQKLHLQQSPQFSSIKKYTTSQSYPVPPVFQTEHQTQLKQKIYMQELEITKLKEQVNKLTRQIQLQRQIRNGQRQCKYCKCKPTTNTNTSSSSSTSPPTQKVLANFKSPSLIFSQSPHNPQKQKIKNLSPSDLQLQSLNFNKISANIDPKIFQTGPTTATARTTTTTTLKHKTYVSTSTAQISNSNTNTSNLNSQESHQMYSSNSYNYNENSQQKQQSKNIQQKQRQQEEQQPWDMMELIQ